VALLQALFNFIRGSAGKALNAVFGWAVLALFGQTSKTEQTLLSGLVAAAAVWPLLALGVIVPRFALFLIAAVPLIGSVPSAWLRIAWVALALLVPIAVGTVVAARSPPSRLPEPGWKRLVRGFPITLALGCALFLLLVIAPAQRVKLALQGWQAARIPLLGERPMGHEIAEAMRRSLAAHGLHLDYARPYRTLTAAPWILQRLGGRAFSSTGAQVLLLRGERLEVVLTANELQLRGAPAELAQAHALAAEVLGPREPLQTLDASAQALERQIKRVWSVYRENPRAHARSRALLKRRDEIAGQLYRTELDYDDWQVVYRELLQLDRALRGEPALLDAAGSKEEGMDAKKGAPAVPSAAGNRPLEQLSTRELVAHTLESVALLVKKEIELARAELRADLKAEVAMAKGLGVAGLCALFAANLILVAVALALGTVMPEWAAALLVAAVVLAVGSVAGLVGWGKRVRDLLPATRRTLKEDVQWAKERIA
jgi:hypothetical protein